MKKLNILFGFCLGLVLMLSYTSCSEDLMDDINQNKNKPNDVQSQFIVPEVITSTAFSVVGADLSFYASTYIEHEVGVAGQMYNAETRMGEPTASATYNNSWGAAYTNIKNARIIIAKCSEGGSESEKKGTLGIAQIMLAYNFAILTDLYGDIPCTEAGFSNPDGTPKYTNPKVDKQEDVYKIIIKSLDDAIVNLKGASNTLGNQDFIYSGNSVLWTKAAYGLKARYTMRLLAKSANKTQDLNNILDYVSKSFASPSEEFKYNKYDGSKANNPFFSFYFARNYFGASESFLGKLIAKHDPRASQLYMDQGWVQTTDPLEVYTAPNGTPDEVQDSYSISIVYGAQTAPTQLMSYHELKFLQAEALARLNRKDDAELALKTAVSTAFVNLANAMNAALESPAIASSGGISATVTLDDPQVINDYLTTSVKPAFDANPLKEIMLQKYLGFYGAGGEVLEAYNDYRRLQALGESSFIELKNPLNSSQFPLRYTYGNSDVSANPNVNQAYGDGKYVYVEKVWWAGGTR